MSLMRVCLAALVALFFSASVSFAAGVCSDGTPYGKCSTVNPGNYCTGALESPSLSMYPRLCRCEAVPGWVQQGEGDTATCIRAKCSDGTAAGECSSTKPKQCVNGALVDNATKCGCPAGRKPSANGITCEYIPCNDSGVSVPEGTCSPKTSGKKCVNGTLVDKASDCKCKSGFQQKAERCVAVCSDGTEAGECSSAKPKECVLSGTGVPVLLDNAAKCGCPAGMRAVGKLCTESSLGGFGSSEIIPVGSPSPSEAGAPGQASGTGLCCCLPTMLIGIAGGFAYWKKPKGYRWI
ncbi:MAG: hypothetical protein N3E51_01380 [Candidatus Micrarchaeota archaeon]|nr:hypothetical protein [Candidatus Micrarchaeota archaeon]